MGTNSPLSVPASKMEIFVHITSHNAPYVHLRLDLILELYQTFTIELDRDRKIDGLLDASVAELFLVYGIVSNPSQVLFPGSK